MIEKIDKIKVQFAVGTLLEIALIALVFIVWGTSFIWFPIILVVANTAALGYIIITVERQSQKNIVTISRVLGSDAKNAMLYGGIGLVTYNENNVVTWMSDLFEQRQVNYLNEHLSDWDEAFQKMFKEDIDQIEIDEGQYRYEVYRNAQARLLYFKDITEYATLKTQYHEDKLVLGLIHFDNYEETTQYEEEQTINYIDTQIRQPVVRWAIDHGMVIRRVKSDRYLIILNERIFSQIEEENFSILSEVRNKSQKNDLSITLSMVFGRESSNLTELDDTTNRLLELAQSRGGDQVAYRKVGKEVKYFGGRSESQEKRSRVRVRVMSNTLKDLISDATDIYIVGHKTMDFDCMGSALGMSRLAQSYRKATYIVSKTGGIEEKLQGCLNQYQEILNQRHQFISEAEALENLTEDSLVIMVDHHNVEQTGNPEIINQASKIVVIDHHRRTTDFTFEPLMVYVESSASSVCELIVEFLPYQKNRVDICAEEATIMMTGILVDTLNFKNRTGSRTFEAASVLKKYGADLSVSDELLRDEYDEFETKTKIIATAIKDDRGVVIAPYHGITSRTMISSVADSFLEVKSVEASFVIAMLDDQQVAISARSNGKINVQAIMERLNGGGHFTAAALQKAGTVDEVKKELEDALVSYFKEEENESNLT